MADNIGTPVYQLTEEMPYTEFLGWMKYYEKRPKGWRDEYNTFQLMRAWGTGKDTKPWDIFPNLYNVFHQEETTKAVDTLKGSAMFEFMMKAKGGDRVF